MILTSIKVHFDDANLCQAVEIPFATVLEFIICSSKLDIWRNQILVDKKKSLNIALIAL